MVGKRFTKLLHKPRTRMQWKLVLLSLVCNAKSYSTRCVSLKCAIAGTYHDKGRNKMIIWPLSSSIRREKHSRNNGIVYSGRKMIAYAFSSWVSKGNSNFLSQLGLDWSTKLVPSSQSIRFKTETNRDLRICILFAFRDDFFVTFVVVCFPFVLLL